jgi:hypothetical protein
MRSVCSNAQEIAVLGFIGRVFTKKQTEGKEVQPVEKPVKAPAPVKQKQAKAPAATQAYFLESDDAMTFGNLEYMRSVKSIRRTFAKEKVGKDNASVRSLSSLAMQKLKAEQQAIAQSAAPQSESSAPVSDRRRADSSMDAFRNMARDIKAKRD